jgi:hypothetical protein
MLDTHFPSVSSVMRQRFLFAPPSSNASVSFHLSQFAVFVATVQCFERGGHSPIMTVYHCMSMTL